MSHYYDNLPHISKSSAELNILCVDDNTNIGSTVFEITRKLKTEIKNYKKINVHWIVLFLPRNDIDIYGGENYVFDYTNRIYYSNKSEKREYEQQYNNQLEEYRQKSLDKKQYNEQLQKFKQNAYNQLYDIIDSHNSDNILLNNILELPTLFTESVNNGEVLLKLCHDIYNDNKYIEFLENVRYFNLNFNEKTQKIIDLIKNNNSEYIKLQQQKTNNHINSLISAFINNISNKTSKSKMNDVYNNLLDTFKQNNYPITGINDKIRKYIRLNYDSNILKQLNNKFEIAISKN